MNLKDFTTQVMNTPHAKRLAAKNEIIDLGDAIQRLKNKSFLVSDDDGFEYIVFEKGKRLEFFDDYWRLMKYLKDEK